jgi:hypothetical protein
MVEMEAEAHMTEVGVEIAGAEVEIVVADSRNKFHVTTIKEMEIFYSTFIADDLG